VYDTEKLVLLGLSPENIARQIRNIYATTGLGMVQHPGAGYYRPAIVPVFLLNSIQSVNIHPGVYEHLTVSEDFLKKCVKKFYYYYYYYYYYCKAIN
jgi:hypothetical protein